MGLKDILKEDEEVEMQMRKINNIEEILDVAKKLDRGKAYNVYYDLNKEWNGDKEEPSNELEHVVEAKGLWNVDKDRRAKEASKDYEITQHHEVMSNVYKGLKESECGTIEGRVRDFGEVIFGELRFKNFDLEVEDDPVNLGLRFGNSFDTSLSVFAEMFGYRTRCSNGMLLGKTQFTSMKRKHVQDDIVVEVKETVKDIFEEKDNLIEVIEVAKDDYLTLEEGNYILGEVGFGKMYRREILRKMDENSDELNRWLAYNAATEVVEEKREDIKENTREKHHDKANRILSQPTEELIEEEV